MSNETRAPVIEPVTVIGWGLLLMPLLTMWHEIGGHATSCIALGGHVATIGAFYVDCTGLSPLRDVVVACAGPIANVALAILAWSLGHRPAGGPTRIVLWWIWVSEAFVASGYVLFSGVSGFGDLGIGEGGSLSGLGLGWWFRLVEIAIGAASYALLVVAAIRALNRIIGLGPQTRMARRRLAHLYYLSAGIAAVLVGLLNPLGLVITLMSAAASSLGGLAGFISIGYATGETGEARQVALPRSRAMLAAGLAASLAFALILGPSRHFAP